MLSHRAQEKIDKYRDGYAAQDDDVYYYIYAQDVRKCPPLSHTELQR